MTRISSLSRAIQNATLGYREDIHFFKSNRFLSGTTPANPLPVLTAISLWEFDGQPGGASASPPVTATACGRATVGTLQQTDPGGGRQKWVTGFRASYNAPTSGHVTPGVLMLYDRLLHMGSLSAGGGLQSVGGAITRYTNGIGNEIWLELYSTNTLAAGAGSIFATYVNQAGTPGCTTVPRQIGGTGFREEHRVLRLPLAAGDYGVRSITSVQATGTTGTFAILLTHPLLTLPGLNAHGISVLRTFSNDPIGPVEVQTDACLAFFWRQWTNAYTMVAIQGALHMVEA